MNPLSTSTVEVPGSQRLFFEDFELRLDSGELFQGGSPVKLQPQPAKVLEALASRSGEVVSREEIRQLVWGDAFVDFDASLNFCVKEIRRALGDSATSPRFVETVPRRGYRFLMSVRTAKDSRELPLPASPPPALPAPKRWWPRLGAAGVVIGRLVLLTLLLGSSLPPVPSPKDGPKTKPKPASESANEAWLQGLYLLDREEYEKAEARFGDVILLDPNFAPAYAKLARARTKLDPPADIEVTEKTVRHSLELDPGLADAHTLLGEILLGHHLDWDGARQELERALELNPDNAEAAEAHRMHSYYLEALGRHTEAMAAIQRARALDPPSMMIGANYAWYFYLNRQYKEAIRQARIVLELYPSSAESTPKAAKQALIGCHDTILLSARMLGDQDTALASAKALLATIDPEEAARLQDVEEYFRGREQRIQKALLTRDVDSFQLAKAAMALGKRDRALDLLSRCDPPDTLYVPIAAVEPLFDELHDDPQWPKVLDCLKLPADALARTGRAR